MASIDLQFTPTLWVGTNAGQVLVYAINLPSSAAQRQTEQVTTQLAKEIQLKHKAPVIAIFTTPSEPEPVPLPNEEGSAEPIEAATGTTNGHGAVANELSTQNGAEGSTEAPASSPGEQEQRAGTPAPPADTSATASPAKSSKASSPSKLGKNDKDNFIQPRVLICSEEQFKVFNLPNLKASHKFKLTAHEGLRARKIHLTLFVRPTGATSGNQQLGAVGHQLVSNKTVQSLATQTSASPTPTPQQDSNGGGQPLANGATQEAATNGVRPGSPTANNNNNNITTNNNNNTKSHSFAKDILTATFGGSNQSQNVTADSINVQQQILEPYMVCMSNQGDCAVYSVPDLKRQAQIQVCKREDVNGITSTILTNYGEGFYLQSTSDFLRFSISTQRVLRCLSVV